MSNSLSLPSSSIVPISSTEPSSFDTPSTASASASTPPYTDNGPHSDIRPPASSSLLNYYFLLLAVFILIFGLVYYVLRRRRRQKIARLRSNGQNALAQDLEGWPGGWRRPGGRWSSRARENRREEGLDEQGEAPPPYMPKEPEEAIVRGEGSGGGIMLREMGDQDTKPPDYQERGNVYR